MALCTASTHCFVLSMSSTVQRKLITLSVCPISTNPPAGRGFADPTRVPDRGSTVAASALCHLLGLCVHPSTTTLARSRASGAILGQVAICSWQAIRPWYAIRPGMYRSRHSWRMSSPSGWLGQCFAARQSNSPGRCLFQNGRKSILCIASVGTRFPEPAHHFGHSCPGAALRTVRNRHRMRLLCQAFLEPWLPRVD